MSHLFYGFPKASAGIMPACALLNNVIRVWAGRDQRTFADPMPFRANIATHWAIVDREMQHNIVAYIDTGIPLGPSYIESLEAAEAAVRLARKRILSQATVEASARLFTPSPKTTWPNQ